MPTFLSSLHPFLHQNYLNLCSQQNRFLIERIISTGQTTPLGEWYDQETDEWVILLQGKAELSYEDGERIGLQAGDYLVIPAHVKHRVEYTSQETSLYLAGCFISSRAC